jgi:putative SOS response-associated peptidase YedK
MEKDHEKTSHWFDLQPNELLQGLLTVQNDVPRVYVVTTDTPEAYSYIHDRWPRIIERSATS